MINKGIWALKQGLHQLKSLFDRTRLGVPKVVECNICGWQGRRFAGDSWHPHVVCPGCRSKVRHRLLAAALLHIESISYQSIIQYKRVLHFAPENQLLTLLKKYSSNYLTADLYRKDADQVMNISHMPQIKEKAFDTVIACDVLEHVENDLQALREIYRILVPGGYAILTVPQKDNLVQTLEDPAAPPAERKRRFGQANHLRIYGSDFPARLESAGFHVTIINETHFNDYLVKKHVLFPPVLSNKPVATNYRKIFFAQKV